MFRGFWWGGRMKNTLIELEEFITHPDNEFITDNERNAFYILAEALRKHIDKYEVEKWVGNILTNYTT